MGPEPTSNIPAGFYKNPAIPSACLAEATFSALHLAIHGAGAQILIVLGGENRRNEEEKGCVSICWEVLQNSFFLKSTFRMYSSLFKEKMVIIGS